MDTEAAMRKLVELSFGEKPTIPEDKAAHSSTPSSLFNDDFPKRLENVLEFRKYLVSDRWQDTLDSRIYKMLFSHQSYVSYVMNFCLHENIWNTNIFDSFISVCALLNLIRDEAFLQTQVDFSGLNPDIFMVFYRKELNKHFQKRKDFYRLVKYIRNHKYHKWLNYSTNSALQERYMDNLGEELFNYRAADKVLIDNVSELKDAGESLAREVLLSSSAILPDLPSETELIEKLLAYRKREKARKAGRKDEKSLTLETLHGEASLNSDSKTDLSEPQENAAWHENIIEAVIRHNHSKDSGKEVTNKNLHEKANGFLEHLESKIKSLIEILDKCSKE